MDPALREELEFQVADLTSHRVDELRSQYAREQRLGAEWDWAEATEGLTERIRELAEVVRSAGQSKDADRLEAAGFHASSIDELVAEHERAASMVEKLL